VFGWFRRIRAGEGVPRTRFIGRKKRGDDGYQQKVEAVLVAALTGDQRQEYLDALAERSALLKEFGIGWIYECTRDFTRGDPVVLSPAEIRQRTARLRRTLIAERTNPSPLRIEQGRPATTP
jgi:hypothetical protein